MSQQLQGALPRKQNLVVAVSALCPTWEGAVADMGDGAVFDEDGRLVAFHERHLSALERREAISLR